MYISQLHTEFCIKKELIKERAYLNNIVLLWLKSAVKLNINKF